MASIAYPAVEVPQAEVAAPQVPLLPDLPVAFVIPAFNEEENLPRLFADLERRPRLFPEGSRVFIVDDGSTDATAELVEQYEGGLPVELVRLEHNQGPGAAFRAGFDRALEVMPTEGYIVTLEADTTSDLDALPRMLAAASNGAHLVLASWTMVNVSRKRQVLSKGAGYVFRHMLGVEAETVSSFFRVYRASTLRSAFAHYGADLMRERGFACKAELLAKLAALGARIEEVPVGLDSSRRVGESKMPIFRTVLGYWRMMARQRLHRVAA